MSKLSVILCTALLTVSGASLAADPPREPRGAPDLPGPDLRGPIARVFNEETVSLLFDYLRQSVRSAADGKPAPKPPAELTQRMQEAGEALRRESANAALGALDEMERELKEALRDRRGEQRI